MAGRLADLLDDADHARLAATYGAPQPPSDQDFPAPADAERTYLVQISSGRRVMPRIPHALDTSVQSPPLARFLAEVADARSAVFRGFDLGAARVLPYAAATIREVLNVSGSVPGGISTSARRYQSGQAFPSNAISAKFQRCEQIRNPVSTAS